MGAAQAVGHGDERPVVGGRTVDFRQVHAVRLDDLTHLRAGGVLPTTRYGVLACIQAT
jgi:hypothetical protein